MPKPITKAVLVADLAAQAGTQPEGRIRVSGGAYNRYHKPSCGRRHRRPARSGQI